MLRLRYSLPGLLVILVSAWADTVTAQDMPIHSPLRQAESEHFIYVFEESLASRFDHLVKTCEDAHALLTPVFRWEPKQKTVVLYADSQDVHNGWATVYPRPTIFLLAADAPPGTTIFEPGDYLRRTFLHEYTHVLLADAQYGIDAGLSAIFGRVMTVGDPLSLLVMLAAAPPGMFAPSWYQEGFSIWSETELADAGGRGRNSRVDMMMRMAVADKRTVDGTQWYLEYPHWPYGAVPYLYGMKVAEHIHAECAFSAQRNALGEIADAVSRGSIFTFNTRPRQTCGVTFSCLAADAMTREKERQRISIAALQVGALTSLPRLTSEDIIGASPVFGPDGSHVYFAGMEDDERSSLYVYDHATGRTSKMRTARTTYSLVSPLTSGPGNRQIYYTRLDIHGRDRVRTELYALDCATGKTRRVARGGRYRYPCIRPDGSAVAAVAVCVGGQALVEMPFTRNATLGKERCLVSSPYGTALVDPTYSADGKYLLYVRADEKGSTLVRLDPTSGDGETLLDWPCRILSPAYHPTSGDILFVADRNGVYNLYRRRAGGNGEVEALTHVLGGLFDPAFSRDGSLLTAVGYDSHGYYVTVVDYEAMAPLPLNLPRAVRAWPTQTVPRDTHAVTQNPSAAVSSFAKATADSRQDKRLSFRGAAGESCRYNSFKEVRFDYWSPWLTLTEECSSGGFFAAWSDPAGFQSLHMLAGVESEYGKSVADAVYRYAGIYPLLALYGSYGPAEYSGLVEDAYGFRFDHVETVGSAGIAATVPLPRVDRTWSASVGLGLTDRHTIDEDVLYNGRPLSSPAPFEGLESALWLRVEFLNATSFPGSHSQEQGRYASITADWADDALGSDLCRTRWRADWREYVRAPWAAGHVLKLEAVYGNGGGDETTQGYFGLGHGMLTPSHQFGVDRTISVRGYSANYAVGEEAVKFGAAYRFPVLPVYRSSTTGSPVYYQQLYGEAYYETAKATGGFRAFAGEWLDAAGLEMNLSLTLLHVLSVAPGAGVAYAFDRVEGEDNWQFYLSVKSVVSF